MTAYAYCPGCGLDFISTVFLVSHAQELMLSECREECPRCGGLANTMEGTFNFGRADAPPIVVSAPEWTERLIERMTNPI